VICPKELRLAWEEARSLPAGWMVWNFGAIRGRDEANSVLQLVVVSRPLPKPAQVEIMAETIFGRKVDRLPTGLWYPKSPVGRLLIDGTGRRALALRHPDPLAEAIRFAICEGELVQAVGRGRGVRRTAETPLEVLVLTDVPIPLPLNKLTTWKRALRLRTARPACCKRHRAARLRRNCDCAVPVVRRQCEAQKLASISSRNPLKIQGDSEDGSQYRRCRCVRVWRNFL
jgi:hypothetical protein